MKLRNEKHYNTLEFAKMLWVYPSTLDNWDKSGKFVAKRDPVGRKYYTDEDFEEIQRRVKAGEFKSSRKKGTK